MRIQRLRPGQPVGEGAALQLGADRVNGGRDAG